jgi:hypothetical protein
MNELSAASPARVGRYAQVLVHGAAGTLLMTAALLKAYQLIAGPVEVRSLPARLLELGLIEFELILATMLLLDVLPLLAQYLALTAFTVFGVLSLRKAISGAPTCGCFGPVDIDPRITTAIDLVMVVLLAAIGPPRPRSGTLSDRRWRRAGLVALVVLMLLAAGAAVFAAIPRRGLVVANGAVHDFGLVPADRAARCGHVFVIRNTASHPVRITGFDSSCGCTVAHLPASAIPPGGGGQCSCAG